jgi:high-affinity nickel-transport protein
MILKLFNDQDAEVGGKVIGIYVVLVVANVLAWIWALVAFHDYPVLIGTAFLAYTFGLRHAVDADHIAAIDNVTRKLMQEGKRPVAVGFVLFARTFDHRGAGSAAIALATAPARPLRVVSSVVGGHRHAGVGAFPVPGRGCEFRRSVLGLSDLPQRARRQRLRRGGPQSSVGATRFSRPPVPADVPPGVAQLAHVSARLPVRARLRYRDRDRAPRHRRGASLQGLPIWSIMVFPALFTAGMSLVDTTDGVLMLGAYGWAFNKPIRKLYYNLTITFVSVLVAVLIGGIEALGLLADRLSLVGPFWSFIGRLNDNFGNLGYLIIAIFIVSWLVSIAVYRLGRFDRLEPAG